MIFLRMIERKSLKRKRRKSKTGLIKPVFSLKVVFLFRNFPIIDIIKKIEW